MFLFAGWLVGLFEALFRLLSMVSLAYSVPELLGCRSVDDGESGLRSVMNDFCS